MNKQFKMFEDEDFWEKEWVDMPSFSMSPEIPVHTISLHFKTETDMIEFSKLIKQDVKKSKENYWFPKLNRCAVSEKKYYTNEH
jgi:hypothetical protein